MGKLKSKHKYRISIVERVLPIERIVKLFRDRFDQPYLNPLAELTLSEFKAAFPEIPEETVLSALSHWTDYSAFKVLQKKILRINNEESPVWFVHGLDEGGIVLLEKESGSLRQQV